VRRKSAVTGEAVAGGARVLLTVEMENGLTETEVAGRPGVRTREVAGQEPVGGPFADTGNRDEPGLHLVVRQGREPVEIEVGARQSDHVLRLAARESERQELVGLGTGHALAGRERVRVLEGFPESLDEPVAHREGGVEGDLLRGDRGDESLVGIGRERGAKSPQAVGEAGQHRLGRGERGEAVEVERAA
jgi:hypothetical protein